MSSRTADMEVLREVIMRHTSKRLPTTHSEIYDAVLNDYGSCCERRVYRAIALLLQHGALRVSRVVTDDKGRYREYLRVLDEAPALPDTEPRSCGNCGMVGVSYRSHVGHRLHRWFRHGNWPRRSRVSSVDRYGSEMMRRKDYVVWSKAICEPTGTSRSA